jgi:hypothetical protein
MGITDFLDQTRMDTDEGWGQALKFSIFAYALSDGFPNPRMIRATGLPCNGPQKILKWLVEAETSAGSVEINRRYFTPTTMESGPTRCSTRVSLKPTFFIQPEQSAPV